MNNLMLSNNYIGILLKEIYRTLYQYQGFLDWWPGDTDFEICVGAILTQNTAWSNVEKAIANLKTAGVLDCGSIINMPKEKLAELIRPSGYFNQKAGYLKEFCNFLSKNPVEELKKKEDNEAKKIILAIKGIGKETADSIVLYALNKPVFVVDAYTKRVFHRIGIVEENISYDDMQKIFYSNLEKDTDLYKDYHAQIVLLGKEFCKKSSPSCADCPLKREGICRYHGL
jgi:endonuclease III related protein